MNPNSAVLIFANTSRKELSEKAIPSLQLFDKLNSKVLKTVQKSGLPYFLITENEQKGASFGERFSNAIEAIFEKGFENVISIGNDTPQLSVDHLKKAYSLLQDEKIVLGPSRDGGFYLMGIQKKFFNKNQFLKLPWQTGRLSSYVERLVSKSDAEVVRLQTLQDIDDRKDLHSVLNIFGKISSEIKNLILQLLNKPKEIFRFPIEKYSGFFPKSFYNKGSPVQLHY